MRRPEDPSVPAAPPATGTALAPASGTTSWFCCGAAWGPCGGAGTGACGTCQSRNHQCAWPNTSDACFAITRPDRCGENLIRRVCGHRFVVTNRCNGAGVSVTIADCGPQTDLFCGEQSCCGSVCGVNRIMDLTPSAFSAIASLSRGLTPCTVVTP
jgi:hypothetical protein